MFKKSKNGVVGGLLVRIEQFKFVAACLVIHKCFLLSGNVSEHLRNKEKNLSTAAAAVKNRSATFESLRSKKELNKLISDTSFSMDRVQNLVAAHLTLLKRRFYFSNRFDDIQTILTL